jgi:Na+-transporting methylmalonyl-CoA/oxaloacetate decarboxylase gamma subunit
MDILFALMLAAIGMSVVMAFLGIMVLLLNALSKVDSSLQWMRKRNQISQEPRKKITPSAVKKKSSGSVKAGKSIKAGQSDEAEVLAAAVSTYVLLKQKDAQAATAKKSRFRRVWSTAARYDMIGQRMTGGRL